MNDESRAVPAELPFSAVMTQLEAVVAVLEDDRVDLDTALARYEEGIGLARHCMERLNAIDLRVRQLTIE